MLLAVFSYPKHFHITQVAIKHAMKHIPYVTSVAVIWDDTHDVEVPLQVFKDDDNIVLYPWSWLSKDITLDGNNWAGQQIVKLHADLILPQDEFILMDGDLVINQDIDPANILYSNCIPRQHGRYDHVAELLGLGVYDFASCPFMYVKAQWLKNIRHLCETNSHTTIDKRLLSAFETAQSYNNLNYLLEWNVIARYILQVLKLPKRIEYFHRHSVNGPNFYKYYNNEENFVCNGPDNIDLDFYRAEGIWIKEDLMKRLGY